MVSIDNSKEGKIPWNKGKLIGQKLPLQASQVWSIRTLLAKSGNTRDLALFNLAIDSKLRGCDLVALKRGDVAHSNRVLNRATVMQKKTHSPVTFEITDKTRSALERWFAEADIRHDEYIFQSRLHDSPHIGTRTYARIVQGWVQSIGLDPADYGTHSLRRTKASLLYKMRHNLREIQILLGHKKIESTVHYLGITVEDALESSEHLDL
ncbi:tyrosine-type recombinase/integrase [Alteromonas oceanisediminis]|uniref:tyrosine-type recombinase/integrase n=1 Tax=Alteromonas oceanisediminis TaxID=2836180 RepID=UPI001BDAE855|nr:tyrosine-type recombinase/integrase [Alteromonas oceanisediminis]MBT0587942.1 tyrosine-type recombinase/integrase [Alteromonas oceanisediminis]